MGIIKAICILIRAFLVPRLILAAENLALRQQVAVCHRVDRTWCSNQHVVAFCLQFPRGREACGE